MAKERIDETGNIEVNLVSGFSDSDFNSRLGLVWDTTNAPVNGRYFAKLAGANEYIDGRLEGEGQQSTSSQKTGVMATRGVNMRFAAATTGTGPVPQASIGGGIVGNGAGRVKAVPRPTNGNTTAKLGSGTIRGGTVQEFEVNFNGS